MLPSQAMCTSSIPFQLIMGRTKGSTTAAKVVKSDSGRKEAPKVSSHGYTPEETEAAFFLFMEDQKKKEPGLKLSDAVGLWNALPVNEKNVNKMYKFH